MTTEHTPIEEQSLEKLAQEIFDFAKKEGHLCSFIFAKAISNLIEAREKALKDEVGQQNEKIGELTIAKDNAVAKVRRLGERISELEADIAACIEPKKSDDIELKEYNEQWKKIPMNDIWPEVRRLAVLWARDYHDIRETHKLAQDIQNMIIYFQNKVLDRGT